MHSRIFSGGIILISMFLLSCSSHAYEASAGGELGCPQVFINSIEILGDSDTYAAGVQIPPAVPKQCIGVLRCSSTPVEACIKEGGKEICSFNSSGDNVGIDKGGYCLDPSGRPVLCSNYPVSECLGECSFHEKGDWAGYKLGEYCYNKNDGYEGIDGAGIKTVMVRANISSTGGIMQICSGGSVIMTVDNYKSRGKYPVSLINPQECASNPNETSAVWTGNLTLHYWEKPGWYKISLDATTACITSDSKQAYFEYQSSSQLCVAPEKINLDYGVMRCDFNNVTIYGDMKMGSCDQSDLSTPKATIRNIGNTMINTLIKSTDLVCTSPGCVDVIPATISSLQRGGYLQIDVGNGWEDLHTDLQRMYLTPHCGCINNYGLPPGPHATNILNLRVRPIPCVKPGKYKQTFTILPDITKVDCQDIREQKYPDNESCILPPQCYEIPGRYPFGTNCTGY